MTSLKEFNANTKLCAVIGNPIEHSLSPLIHNAAFKSLNLNYVYLAFRVENIAGAIMGMRSLENMVGLSVTIPHKVQVINYLDEIDDIAQNIGSVNTLYSAQGKVKGYCTDGLGALKAIESAGVTLDNKKILILGSGGAARAVAFTIAMKTALNSMSILGVEVLELEKLTSDISARTHFDSITGDCLSEMTMKREIDNADILINCSPVGMYPNFNDSPIDKSYLHRDLTVMDIIYNPLKTRLLKEAEEIGCKIIPGLEMFINQAALQFELWTNQKAPVNVMREAILK
ncbi:MAG: shikimate dehydrogenase [bacterium]